MINWFQIFLRGLVSIPAFAMAFAVICLFSMFAAMIGFLLFNLLGLGNPFSFAESWSSASSVVPLFFIFGLLCSWPLWITKNFVVQLPDLFDGAMNKDADAFKKLLRTQSAIIIDSSPWWWNEILNGLRDWVKWVFLLENSPSEDDLSTSGPEENE
tara:strand:+ start:436 stop:903 length:468 start_codon:yes stop_codon:yes gene_type:complete